MEIINYKKQQYLGGDFPQIYNYGMKSRDAIERALSGAWQQKERADKLVEERKSENAEPMKEIYQKLQKIRENIQEQYSSGNRSISEMVMKVLNYNYKLEQK